VKLNSKNFEQHNYPCDYILLLSGLLYTLFISHNKLLRCVVLVDRWRPKGPLLCINIKMLWA